MVAENSAPVGVAGAIPGGPVAVAMFAARVRLALGAQFPAPSGPAAAERDNAPLCKILAKKLQCLLKLSKFNSLAVARTVATAVGRVAAFLANSCGSQQRIIKYSVLSDVTKPSVVKVS